MNKGLLIALGVVVLAFVAFLPANLRKLNQARRDAEESDALSRRISEAGAQRKQEQRDADSLEQNRRKVASAPGDADAHIAYAKSLAAAGFPLDAATQYREAASLAPKRPEPHAELGRIYVGLGYTDLAVEELQAQVALVPDDEQSTLLLSYTLGRLGKLREAEELLTAAQGRHPGSKKLLIGISIIRLAASDFAGARAAAESACRLAPADPAALRNLAKVYERSSMAREEERVLRKAMMEDPGNASDRVMLAQIQAGQPAGRAEAIRTLRQVISEQPQHLGARLTLAQVLIEDRKYEEAIPQLEAIRQQQPAFAGALPLLGQALMRVGRTREGAVLLAEDRRAKSAELQLTNLQIQAAMRPGDYRVRIALGEQLVRRGQYGQALYELKTVPSSDRGYSEARRLMRTAFVRSGRLVELQELFTGRKYPTAVVTLRGSADEAAALVRQVADLQTQLVNNPKDARTWLRLGAALGKAGEYEESIVVLERAAELAPKDPLSWRALARAYQLAGHKAEQIVALRRWVAAAPADSDAYQRQAAAMLAAGWVADSLPVALRAVELSPASASAHKLLGQIYFFQGDKTASSRELGRARQLNPLDPEIDHQIALNHTMVAEYAQARSVLDSLLAREPRYLAALLLRGNCFQQLAPPDLAAAERDYKAVIAAEPDNLIGHTDLGILYYKQRRLREAASELETAIRLRPTYVEALQPLSKVYLLLGRNEDARRIIARYQPIEALQLKLHRLQLTAGQMPRNASARLALGRFYGTLGRVEDAVAELSRGLELAPTNASLKQALRQALDQRAAAEDSRLAVPQTRSASASAARVAQRR